MRQERSWHWGLLIVLRGKVTGVQHTRLVTFAAALVQTAVEVTAIGATAMAIGAFASTPVDGPIGPVAGLIALDVVGDAATVPEGTGTVNIVATCLDDLHGVECANDPEIYHETLGFGHSEVISEKFM